MAYDEQLAARIRAVIRDRRDLTERRMFGGLAFLVSGNMAVAASGHGGLMVRVGAEACDALLASTPAYPMEMHGRPMSGWLRVRGEDLADDQALARWVERGTAFAASLPPK